MKLAHWIGALLCSLTLGLGTPLAQAGNETGNAGDSAEIFPIGYEFKRIGIAIAALLQSWGKAGLPEIDSQAFKQAAESVTVEPVTYTLYFRGKTVEAKNYPKQNLIRVNIRSWEKLALLTDRKWGLVCHEILGILGLEINTHELSSRFTAILFEKAIERMAPPPPKELQWTCTAYCGRGCANYDLNFDPALGFCAEPVTQTGSSPDGIFREMQRDCLEGYPRGSRFFGSYSTDGYSGIQYNSPTTGANCRKE